VIVGSPREIKIHEYRVGLVPETVRELHRGGHAVLIERDAGAGIGIRDSDYQSAGAEIVGSAAEVFDRADMIVKVKEPQTVECSLLRRGQILFTYLHLAADPALARRLMSSGVTAIAYETVSDRGGRLPLLQPMSQVAGRMAVQVGAHYLEKANGGAGVLLPGVPGVERGNVVILGGGTAGANAAAVALGMGADVLVLQRSQQRVQELNDLFRGALHVVQATAGAIERHVPRADLLIGAVLGSPGAVAPRLVGRDLVARMRPGSVIVDIAIDQGGCIATSRPTTHAAPTYVEEGVIHYCVTNMPGAVARTSALALNNATRPHILRLADLGVDEALRSDEYLANGLNVRDGRPVHPAVIACLGSDDAKLMRE